MCRWNLVQKRTIFLQENACKKLVCNMVDVCSDRSILTHIQLETHGCVLSTVDTDALVLKHQGISIHRADQIFIVIGPISFRNRTIIGDNTKKRNYILNKNHPVVWGLMYFTFIISYPVPHWLALHLRIDKQKQVHTQSNFTFYHTNTLLQSVSQKAKNCHRSASSRT